MASQSLVCMPATTWLSLDPEGGGDPAGEVAADHEFVVAGRADVPDVLHAEVVLVGEEVRLPDVGLVVAEHAAGGVAALVDGGVPVFDSDPAEEWVVVVGDVAGGVDMRVVGAQPGVDQDAVVGGQPGRCRELVVGFGADADQDQVRGELGSRRRAGPWSGPGCG